MVSVVNPRQADMSDDLLHIDSPPLRRRPSDPEFSDRLLLTDKPSFARRAARAFIRFFAVFFFGVAATLAWQSYGDDTRQSIATWAAERGWPTDWLSYGQAQKADSAPRLATSEAPATQGASSAPAANSDLQQLKTMTLGLAATVNTMRARLDQLTLGQEQSASDIAKLQAAEQDIRQRISAPGQRAGTAPASKPAATAPPSRAPAPPR
jgi:hypothetical protein